MNEAAWKKFLTEYNSELLSYEEVVEALPPETISAGWLGYPGASETEITTIEMRLAARLPPSYRAFLKVSKGWRFPSVSIFDLLPPTDVAWFREQNQDWIDAYVEPSAQLPPIPDETYFVYGDKQGCINFRTEYLHTALQVSGHGDSAVVLLNPEVISAGGEWETWFFANWLPGAVRYRSFAEWMIAERQACQEQLTLLPQGKLRKYVTAKKPVSVRKAQEAARSGRTELALEALEAFAAKGQDSAAASLAELYAFLNRWDKVIINAGRLIANPGAVYAGNVFDDMIRLLGRAGHRLGEWQSVIEVVEVASKANASRSFSDYKEANRERNEKVFRNLVAYSTRLGEPPHELLAIFGVRETFARMSRKECESWYQNAVQNVDSIRPDLKKNPAAKPEYFFALAKDILEDEALRLFEAHGKNFLLAWQAVEYVAPIYVRRGNSEAAWSSIESNLKSWWPVDQAQIAPVVLLTDENLETLMTPERCYRVLSTERGPEGATGRK